MATPPSVHSDAKHPNTAGQSQQRSHKHRLEEAAKYIVHQSQADWRFELSDSGS